MRQRKESLQAPTGDEFRLLRFVAIPHRVNNSKELYCMGVAKKKSKHYSETIPLNTERRKVAIQGYDR